MAAAILGAVVAWRLSNGVTGDDGGAPVTTTTATAPTALTPGEVYDAVLPSIVAIRADGPTDVGADAPTARSGTGVVTNADGSITTALHVVDGADSIEVVFADGTRSMARVASSDADLDTAVLAPDLLPEIVVPAVIGRAAAVAVGDTAMAIGHPFGLTASLTSGVISGVGRTVPRSDGAGELEGLVQFDAAVNPGSSGGPLLDDRGEVIGIVTTIATVEDGGGFVGVGFAVPIDEALGGGGPAPAR